MGLINRDQYTVLNLGLTIQCKDGAECSGSSADQEASFINWNVCVRWQGDTDVPKWECKQSLS